MSNQDKSNQNPENMEQQSQNQEKPSPQLTEDNLLYKYYSKYGYSEELLNKKEETKVEVEKTEDKVQEVEKNNKSVEKKTKEPFDIVEFVSELGYKIGASFSKLLGFIWFLIMLPAGKIASLLKKLWAWIDRAYLISVRRFFSEYAYFRKEVKAVKTDVLSAIKNSPKSVFKIIWGYFKKARRRHPRMFKTISNFMTPVVAAIVLITTITFWSGATFALEVKCNGQKLGYISDESVYLNAQKIVEERLETSSKTTKKVLKAPEYKLTLVSPNELTDAQTISDRIVENTEGNITAACGVYIDGKFVCAIKNEMDAIQVFNSILDDYKTDDPNDVVDFVEDVKYVQGLYPDNDKTIWNTTKLLDKLKGKKQSAQYYTVQDGDTLSGIAVKCDVKLSELMSLNPDFTETIRVGDKLLVSNQVDYLSIKVVKTVVSEQSIPFETEKQENSKLFKKTKRVKIKGATGVANVTNLVTYINGVQVSAKEISREVVKDPVNEIIEVGTKSNSVYGNYSGGSVATGGRLVWPTIGIHSISSPYGPRNGGFHRGIDISGHGASGHIIVAAKSGRVVSAGWGGAYGYRVIIDHGSGMQTLYGHCLSGSISVRAGQSVSAGQAIARVGSTGNSTGPHLHFEVRRSGRKVNPAPYLGLR